MNELNEPLVEGNSPPPSDTICPVCGTTFKYRRNKTYCSSKCRKTDSKRRGRAESDIPENRRYRLERFNLATELGETFYSLKPEDRAEFLVSLIHRAQSGSEPLLRDILTSRYWIKPDRTKPHLFPRSQPRAYKTIAQLANILCLRSPLAEPVHIVVKRRADLDLSWVTNIEGDGLPTEAGYQLETGSYSPLRIHPFYTGEDYPFRFPRKLYPSDAEYLLRRTPSSHWENVATVRRSHLNLDGDEERKAA